MTNKEKAREIAKTYDKSEYSVSFMSSIVTAEWKDTQFKEYLEEKKTQYSQAITTFDVMRKKVFDEIINELFGK